MVRIAISGSHSLGKSTFVHDWVHQHPEYIREEEPYRALRDWYAIEFKDGSTRLHNGIQLHYNASRVNRYHDSQDNVIFDRAPVDYIAYSQYTANQGTTDICDAFVDALVPTVRDSLRFLDVLVFIPISEQWPIAMEDDGIRPVDLAYRDEVDELFKQIYRQQRWQVMPTEQVPLLVELSGSRTDRVKQLEDTIQNWSAAHGEGLSPPMQTMTS